MDYPVTKEDIKHINDGDRILVIYENSDKDSNYHIMRISADIKIIMASEDNRLSNEDVQKLSVYPHPSCEKVCRHPIVLNDQQKERLLANVYEKSDKSAKRALLICSIVLMVCLITMIVILVALSEIEIIQAVIHVILSVLGTWVFYVLLLKLRERNKSNWTSFNEVTEVVFIRTDKQMRGCPSAHVYEWLKDSFEDVEYTNAVVQDAVMGDILYKSEATGYTFFYKKE